MLNNLPRRKFIKNLAKEFIIIITDYNQLYVCCICVFDIWRYYLQCYILISVRRLLFETRSSLLQTNALIVFVTLTLVANS